MSSSNQPAVTFRVSAEAFPSQWRELKKQLGARAASRTTEEHPTWMRIDGHGFTIWLSEVRLADSSTEPPVWETRMESLNPLPPEGQRRWEEVHGGIIGFLENLGLPFEAI